MNLNEIMHKMRDMGLNDEASGNASYRTFGGFMVTPTRDISSVEVFCQHGVEPVGPASSEWRMHAAIYTSRQEVGAIIHFHGEPDPDRDTSVADPGDEGTWRLALEVAYSLMETNYCYIPDHGNVWAGDNLKALDALLLTKNRPPAEAEGRS